MTLDDYPSEVQERLRDNMQRAGEFLVSALREKISIQGPPRSAPGEAPHADTRALLESVTFSTGESGLELEGGSPLDYSLFLELGTINMDARPWLRNTTQEVWSQVMDIIFEGI